jgi:hypothetical protein
MPVPTEWSSLPGVTGAALRCSRLDRFGFATRTTREPISRFASNLRPACEPLYYERATGRIHAASRPGAWEVVAIATLATSATANQMAIRPATATRTPATGAATAAARPSATSPMPSPLVRNTDGRHPARVEMVCCPARSRSRQEHACHVGRNDEADHAQCGEDIRSLRLRTKSSLHRV